VLNRVLDETVHQRIPSSAAQPVRWCRANFCCLGFLSEQRFRTCFPAFTLGRLGQQRGPSTIIRCLTLLTTPLCCFQALMYSTAAFAFDADFEVCSRRHILGELRAWLR
jgi:hypothetical protein